MANCIFADMPRVLKKTSVLILTILEVALIIGGVFVIRFLPFIGLNVPLGSILDLASTLFLLFTALPVFLVVFGDDIKSKTMQSAIGYGVSRTKLLIARFLEIILIMIVIMLILIAEMLVITLIFKVPMTGNQSFLNAVKDLGISALESACYIAIAMIAVFWTQSMALAQTLYLCLMFGVVDMLISMTSFIPFLSKHHIDLGKYTVSGLIDTARSGVSYAPVMWVVVVAAYIVLPLVISAAVFRRKELSL